MRVIAGEAKGRRLKGPRGSETRPTSDKVKEALLSILGDRIKDARVLDLFAGSGGVGIEALSRGATHVDFVEVDEAISGILEQNLTACGFGHRASVYRMDAFRFIKQIHRPYDLVFADPPYHAWQLKKLLPVLGQGDMISPDGLAVVEHFHKIRLPKEIGNFVTVRSYEYGDTVLTIYRRRSNE
jgi:16S rRNA (guanine966-N2)-methyltransferase